MVAALLLATVIFNNSDTLVLDSAGCLIERLHPPGHPVTTAVLKTSVEEMHCINYILLKKTD
jgi:hypothetical protein